MKTFPLQPDIVRSEAIYSPCRGYRYTLERTWDENRPAVAFIGLNPSTATEDVDDPTVRRCIGFARSWGCGGLIMLNIFAYRSTDPKKLHRMDRRACVGRKNDKHLLRIAANGVPLVAAWGTHGALHGRHDEVLDLLHNYQLKALRITKEGCPQHPLYLPANLKPEPWR